VNTVAVPALRLPRAVQQALSLIGRLGKARPRPHRLDPLRRIYLSPF
jgi:hypothetical protein